MFVIIVAVFALPTHPKKRKTMTDRTDACRLEQAAEEYAAQHFLNDAEHLLNDPWPEARERYKQALINFGRMILQQLNSEKEER